MDYTEQDERFARATHLLRSGALDDALNLFKSVYTDAEAKGDTELLAASLCEIAWTCFKMGLPEKGLECALGARWLWRRLDNLPELSRALAVEAVLFVDLGFVDEAYELAAEAVDLGRQLGDPALLAFGLNARGIALALCRETDLAIATLEEAVALAMATGNTAATAYYRLNLGFAHSRMAAEAASLEQSDKARTHRGEAIAHSRRAIEEAGEVGDVWTLRVAHCNLAEMQAADGHAASALTTLEHCALLPAVSGQSLNIHFLYTQAAVLEKTGDFDRAAISARQALQLAEAGGQLDHQLNAVEILCRILEIQGDAVGALAMHRRYHRLYVLQSGETARRRAYVEEIRSEADRLRAHAAELADQALSDPLTGIANRRSFDQILNRLAGTPFAVAIVDLDHFKLVNDRHSHIVGDAVLQKVARIMVDHLGPHGHVARLGGEEFALVFPDLPASTAAALCEGVRIAVLNANWLQLAPGLEVSVSIGVAAGEGAKPAGALMQIADERLYRAKSLGRNCVVGAEKVAGPALQFALS
jgi:diguanylate cyclase